MKYTENIHRKHLSFCSVESTSLTCLTNNVQKSSLIGVTSPLAVKTCQSLSQIYHILRELFYPQAMNQFHKECGKILNLLSEFCAFVLRNLTHFGFVFIFEFTRKQGKELTKPYPLLLPVCLSVITTASSMSPNCWKNSRRDSSVVW